MSNERQIVLEPVFESLTREDNPLFENNVIIRPPILWLDSYDQNGMCACRVEFLCEFMSNMSSYYTEARLDVEICNGFVIDMLPRCIMDSHNIKRSITVSPQIPVTNLEGKPTALSLFSFEQEKSFQNSMPAFTTFGYGSSKATWKIEQTNSIILEGTCRFEVMLRIPPQPQVELRMMLRATINHHNTLYKIRNFLVGKNEKFDEKVYTLPLCS